MRPEYENDCPQYLSEYLSYVRTIKNHTERTQEAYYIDLHNGKKTKGQIMGDVEELYNCAKKNSKRATGNYMSRISTYYSKIKSK